MVVNSSGVTPRNQVSMLPVFESGESRAMCSSTSRVAVPELHHSVLEASSRTKCLPGTLNTARSFRHSKSDEHRFDRRRRRTSLPTVCEFSEGGEEEEWVGQSASAPLAPLALGRARQRLVMPESIHNSLVHQPFKPAPPPQRPRPGAPRVHTPLPPSLVHSLGGRSADWLAKRSHQQRGQKVFPDHSAPVMSPRDPTWNGTTSSARSNPTSSHLGPLDMCLEDDNQVLQHRAPVAGRRARLQGSHGVPIPGAPVGSPCGPGSWSPRHMYEEFE